MKIFKNKKIKNLIRGRRGHPERSKSDPGGNGSSLLKISEEFIICPSPVTLVHHRPPSSVLPPKQTVSEKRKV